MSQIVYIYGLFDPREQLPICIRYVGKSTKPYSRRTNHLSPERKRKLSRRAAWIVGLKAAGVKPGMVIIEESDEDNWKNRERYWISALRSHLVNTRDGGQAGGRPPYDWTEEGLAIKSEFQKKRWEDPEYRVYMHQVMMEREQDPDYVARHRAGISTPEWMDRHRMLMEERWEDPEWRAYMTRIKTGRSFDEAFREKQREWRLKEWADGTREPRPHDPRTGQFLRADGTPNPDAKTGWPPGSKHSPETQQKMAKAQKERFARDPSKMVGENNPNAKMSNEQVRMVRARYAVGDISQVALARELGVSANYIHRIVRGTRYVLPEDREV